MIIEKELNSPCKITFALKDVIDSENDNLFTEGNTVVILKMKWDNWSLKAFAERVARPLYGYYRLVEHNSLSNTYKLSNTKDSDQLTTTIYAKDGFLISEIVSNKSYSIN